MKLKTSKIKHPSGIEVETPLFIPSYSSKGFALRKQKGKLKSEICIAIEIAKEILEETLLVSAYDLYYDYLLDPNDFVSTQLTFIDSGGYEISSSFDFSETKRDTVHINGEWNIDYLEKVISNWNKQRFPAVIVSYDDEKDRKPLVNQISDAKKFFSKYDDFLNDFLIKPETRDSEYINIDNIQLSIKKLNKFDIIGVTEKELGNSVLQRMQRICQIRTLLDSANNKAPIHVFGSLDPISSILYFLAGAEIFDGLTWLKYSYYDGLAMYTNNLSTLDKEIQIDTIDRQVKARSIQKNIYFLGRLRNVLINFKNSDEDFEIFDTLGYVGLGKIIKGNYTIFKNR